MPVIQTYNKVKKVFPQEGVTATVVMEVDDVKAGAPTTGIADARPTGWTQSRSCSSRAPS